jgi:hypothetical protein
MIDYDLIWIHGIDENYETILYAQKGNTQIPVAVFVLNGRKVNKNYIESLVMANEVEFSEVEAEVETSTPYYTPETHEDFYL